MKEQALSSAYTAAQAAKATFGHSLKISSEKRIVKATFMQKMQTKTSNLYTTIANHPLYIIVPLAIIGTALLGYRLYYQSYHFTAPIPNQWFPQLLPIDVNKYRFVKDIDMPKQVPDVCTEHPTLFESLLVDETLIVAKKRENILVNYYSALCNSACRRTTQINCLFNEVRAYGQDASINDCTVSATTDWIHCKFLPVKGFSLNGVYSFVARHKEFPFYDFT